MAQIELPTGYHLDHFEYLLKFISDKCEHLLTPEDADFIRRFRASSVDARSLFVRLANRKGVYFRVSKLTYPEIQSISAAVQELQSAQLVQPVTAATPALLILPLFTRSELLDFARQQSLDVPAALKKPELMHWLAERLNIATWFARLQADDPVIEQGCTPELSRLRLMFFGNLYDDMSTFVISDLGHSRFEQLDTSQLTPAFAEPQTLHDKYLLSCAHRRFRILREHLSPALLAGWFKAWLPSRGAKCDSAIQDSLNRLVLQVARFLERAGELSAALEIYSYTQAPPSRERRVRLLHKLGEDEAALALCKQIGAEPVAPEEQIFAEDFEARLLKKQQKAVTRYLKQAAHLEIDWPEGASVEQAVLQHYYALGWQGFFSENRVWRSLLGLLCWPLIFDASGGALHNPFQRVPSNWSMYLRTREDAVKQQLNLLEDAALFTEYVQQLCAEKYGVNNPLVVWYEELPAHIEAFYKALSTVQLQAVLWRIARDPTLYGQGLPDLFIWTEHDRYEFIEVKSPTDSLSAKQLDWLRFLDAQQVKAKVLRVTPLPNQSA